MGDSVQRVRARARATRRQSDEALPDPDRTRPGSAQRPRATPKLAGYVGLGSLGVVIAVIAGRPDLVGLAGPILLAGVVGLVTLPPSTVAVTVEADRVRVVEGDVVTLTVSLEGTPGAWAEVVLDHPPELAVDELPRARATRFGPDGRAQVELRARAAHWGGHPVGSVVVRTRDRFGFFSHEIITDTKLRLKVHPDAELLRMLIGPKRTQVFAGNRLSRAKGEGIEFADLRPYAAGDQERQVNWRATARSGQLWINQHHPERNSDVVLLLDTFNALTLPDAVRAASSLVQVYLEQRDRVGLVSFGGLATWLQPTTGVRQVQRLIDALLDSQVFASVVWRDLNLVPPKMLPPQALVIVISPMEDDRMIAAVEDLRARGIDVAVLEVSPVALSRPAPGPTGATAFRLWQLVRRSRRAKWQRGGIAVVDWDTRRPVSEIIGEVEAYRRHSYGRVV